MEEKIRGKSLVCLAKTNSKSIIKMDMGGREYIPRCNLHHDKTISDERDCIKKQCEFYERRYLQKGIKPYNKGL